MNISVLPERIEEFCRKWHVTEFALFGSVLGDDFGPDSDVDVLVTFEPGVRPTLDHWLDMEDELAAEFGRRVDVVEKLRIENPFIRRHVLDHHRVLYSAEHHDAGRGHAERIGIKEKHRLRWVKITSEEAL
jgi:uncharacterized protein